MTLNIKALSRIATSDRGQRNQTNWYVYSTADASATLTAAGYFNDARQKCNLKKGDRFSCVTSVEGAPAKLDLIVTDVAGDAVTVSAA